MKQRLRTHLGDFRVHIELSNAFIAKCDWIPLKNAAAIPINLLNVSPVRPLGGGSEHR